MSAINDYRTVRDSENGFWVHLRLGRAADEVYDREGMTGDRLSWTQAFMTGFERVYAQRAAEGDAVAATMVAAYRAEKRLIDAAVAEEVAKVMAAE